MGETAELQCVADRDEGVTSSCVVEDGNEIGVYTGVKIRNSGSNRWNCKRIGMVIDGVRQREIATLVSVNDKKTVEAEVSGLTSSCTSLPLSWTNIEARTDSPFSYEYGAVITDLTCSEVGRYNGGASVTCVGDDMFIFSEEDGTPGCTGEGSHIPVLQATMTSFVTTDHPNYLFDGKYDTAAHSDWIDDPHEVNFKWHENGFIFSLRLTYTAAISVIRIVNRKDCCGDRIIGFKVYIINEKGGEVDCGTISENRRKYELRCRGVGNEVHVRKEGKVGVVNLAEVEVFGSEYGEVGCWDSADKTRKGSYNGSQYLTRSGQTCLKWTEITDKNFLPSALPNRGLGDHNYCRNPSGRYEDVWCYYSGWNWDYCDVPSCPVPCPAGWYRDSSTKVCVRCPSDMISEAGASSCTACQSGTQPQDGQTKCGSFCPPSFPYAYLMGDYCCKTGKEKIDAAVGELCDGSDIGIDSKCCQDSAHLVCPTKIDGVKCSNHPRTKTSFRFPGDLITLSRSPSRAFFKTAILLFISSSMSTSSSFSSEELSISCPSKSSQR